MPAEPATPALEPTGDATLAPASPAPPAPGPGAARERRLRLIRLVLVASAVGVVTLLCITVGGTALLAHAEPGWWVEPERGVSEAADRGRTVEEAISRLLSGAEPGMTTRTALYERDANAWLATRLPLWLEAEGVAWPVEVSPLRLRVADGRVHVGVRVSHEGWSRVVSLTLEPRLDEEGRLWAPATALRIGRMGLPVGWVLEGVSTSGRVPEVWREDPRTRLAVAVFRGEVPLVERPVVRLDDRRLRLTDLACEPDRFDLTYTVSRRE